MAMVSPCPQHPLLEVSPAHSNSQVLGIPLLTASPVHGVFLPIPSPSLQHSLPLVSPCPWHRSSTTSPIHILRSMPLPAHSSPSPCHSPASLHAPGASQSCALCSLPAGTGDSTVLNVARLPVLAHSECNRALHGRLKESELCTAPLRAGVGACEVSWAGDTHAREAAGAGTRVTPLSWCHRVITVDHWLASPLTAGCWRG